MVGRIGIQAENWNSSGTGGNNFIHMVHQENDGTNGGAVTALSWQKRELNTLKHNGILNASLNTGTSQITLPVGTYFIESSFQYDGTGYTQLRLRDITDGVTLIAGNTKNSGVVTLYGKFSLPATKVLEIQHYCTSTSGTKDTGQGLLNGEVEIYADVKITMVSTGVGTFDNNFSYNYIGGGSSSDLTIANDGGDLNNDVRVNEGFMYDFYNSSMITILSPIIKQLDTVGGWVQGSNQAGRPVLVPYSINTWYHFFLIWDNTGSLIDAGFDTDINAVNLLAEAQVVNPLYVNYRRLGSVKTSSISTDIRRFTQWGNHFLWTIIKQDLTTTTFPTTAAVYPLTVPIDIEVQAFIQAYGYSTSVSEKYGLLTYMGQDDTVPDSSHFNMLADGNGTSTTKTVNYCGYIKTDTMGQIRGRWSAIGAGSLFQIYTMGWLDNI